MQALESGSQKEISNRKNLLAHEVVKAEEAKKKQIESEKTVVDAIANVSKLEQDFPEKEKVLLARAEKAEKDLETLRTGYESSMKILNQMITCFFGKFITTSFLPLEIMNRFLTNDPVYFLINRPKTW